MPGICPAGVIFWVVEKGIVVFKIRWASRLEIRQEVVRTVPR